MEGTSEASSSTASLMVIVLSILCTIISWAVTWSCIIQHINHWNSPAHQRIVVQMLSLVLVWSLFAVIVVLRPGLVLITKFFMDTYEAYIVALFMSLMREYLGGDSVVRETLQKMPTFKFLICIKISPSMTVFYILRVCIYQFAIVKPSLSLLRLALAYLLQSNPTLNLNLKLIFPIMQGVTLISLVVAMLALLNFYKMFTPALAPYKVAAKFMALKLFIFLHLAQGVIMSQFSTPENHNQVYQLEYFTLCFEMAVAAVLNKYVVFTYREFLTEQTPVKPWVEYFRMDDARLTEWKNVLQTPHIVRQDSYYVENMEKNRHSMKLYQSQSNYSTMISNVYY